MLLALALTLIVSAVVFAEAGGPGNPDPKGQLIPVQLLAFNDYHGHLEATTPGNIEGAPAGGSEYLSAKLSELRKGQKFSLTRVRNPRPFR